MSSTCLPEAPSRKHSLESAPSYLGVDRVGVHHNFFELGGHSLLASQILARVRHTFDVDVPLKEFIEEATVARLARLVEEALSNGTVASETTAGTCPTQRPAAGFLCSATALVPRST